MRRLTGRTAIVTGGASGFGEGIVRRFVAEGARLAIVDVNGPAAEALASALGEAATAMVADVSRDTDIARLATTADKALGQVDILVNNAGVGHLPCKLETLGEDEFDRIAAINMKSVYLTARHFVPGMKASQKRGDPEHRSPPAAGFRGPT